MHIAYRPLVLLVGLAGRLESQSGGGTPRCSAPAVVLRGPANLADAGSFSIRIPVGDTALRLSSFDSEVGGWARDGLRITYDYGAYSNSLDSVAALAGTRRCRATIGGHDAVLLTARDSANHLVVAAHWPRLHSSSLGPVSLTLYGIAVDSARRRELLDMIWSVRIKP
jgi:hypothetical protein